MKPIASIDELCHFIEEKNRVSNIERLRGHIAFIKDISVGIFNDYKVINMVAFVYFTSGQCRMEIDGRSVICGKGSFLTVFPMQYFKVVDRTSDCNGRVILVGREILEKSVSKLSRFADMYLYIRHDPLVKLSLKEQETILDYYRLIIPKLDDTVSPFNIEVVDNLLLSMFFNICNIYSKALLMNRPKLSRREVIAGRFVFEVGRHFRENHKVQYYADLLYVNSKYLSVIIHEHYGCTPSDLIDDCIMHRARNLLRETDMTIQEISYDLGFVNPQVFSKYFSRHQGCTAMQYRLKARP